MQSYTTLNPNATWRDMLNIGPLWVLSMKGSGLVLRWVALEFEEIALMLLQQHGAVGQAERNAGC